MATLSVTELQDCSTICKAFERGCNFSFSEESVFAVMAPQVCTMRNLAKSTVSILDQVRQSNPELITNPSNSQITDETTQRKSLADQWTGDQLFGILGSDCIPCKFKTYSLKELSLKNLLTDTSSALFGPLMKFFQQALEQIQAMVDMLSGKNQYIDICQLLRFFKEFMCVLDIQGIIAAFTMLLMKLSIELSSLFDLIVQLIGPLMLPFLNIVINQIQKLIDLAIKPLECIVNAISEMISKLDINSFFKNLGSINTTIGFQGTSASANINLSQLKDMGQKLDYANSIKQGAQNSLIVVRSMLYQVVDFCKEAVSAVNGIQNLLVGDFLKLLTSITGGGTGMVFQLNKKLALVQLIGVLKALIKLSKKGIKCKTEEEEALNIIPALPLKQDMTIYKDNNGNVVWQQNPTEINNTIKNTIASIMPTGNQPINPEALGNDIVQNLQSLITFTGDEVLDSSISRTIESLTTPVKLTFGCSMQTTVSDAEKVNKWIAELSQ